MAEETNPLEELLVDELKDLYSAENQIIKALPKMARAASSPELKRAFERHLEETRRQVERLNQIGEALETKMTGKKCKGMEGLIEEGKELLEEDLDENALDAGLIGAAQKVEHYEIAAYGTARTHAEMLGYTKVARLLQQTLNEEGATDKKLTQLAESIINVEAVAAYAATVRIRDNARRGRIQLRRALTLARSYFNTSAKNSIARGSFDCPSQKMACLRTAGLALVFAT
jgi:ferritin-like metal-binding protein YciE